MTPWSAPRREATRGALARRSSAASGFFFCGMIEDPEAHASATWQKPNSSERPEDDLRAEPREVRRAGRRGGQEVEHEVAVGDRVDRVRRDLRRSRARARRAGGRSRSSRPPARRRRAAAPPSRRARTRTGSRRGGTSRSRRAGDARGRRAGRAAGACSRASPSPRGARRAARCTLCRCCSLRKRLQRVRAREHGDVGRDLVVARARGVQLAADGAGDLRQPPLDRHVDVLVLVVEPERAAVELLGDTRRGRAGARRGRRRR